MDSLALPPVFRDLQIPLIYVNNIIALAIGPKHRVVQLGVTLPVLLLLVSQSLYKPVEGEWGRRYAFESAILSLVAIYVDWILLASPDKERWRKFQYDKGDKVANDQSKGEKEVPQTFWGRAWWGVRLATTNRYVGWSCQVKNVRMEVDPAYSHPLFVARKTLRAILFFVISDVCKSYSAGSPYGSWLGLVKEQPSIKLEDKPFQYRFWCTWLHILISYTGIELVNAVYGAVSVATGLANPRDCPSAFGDLKELVTVRKAWSVVWHQQCRRLCSAPGIYITRDVLHLGKGTFMSKYLQLFVGFTISGLVHAGASMLIHRSFEDDGALSCFIGQAVIIMVEDHVIEIGKRVGFKDSRFWRLVGFFWTIFAMGASCQSWTTQVIQRGMWVHTKIPDFLGLGPK